MDKYNDDNIFSSIRDVFFILFSLIIFSPFTASGIIQLKYILVLCVIWNILAIVSNTEAYVSVLCKYIHFIFIISSFVFLYYFYYKRFLFSPLFTFAMMTVYYNHTQLKYSQLHINIVLIFYLLVGVYSSYQYTVTPALARILAAGDLTITSQYVSFFSANYSLVFMIGVTTFITLYNMLNTKNNLWVLVVIFSLYFLYKSQYMTSLLVAIVGIIITLMLKIKSRYFKIFISIFLISGVVIYFFNLSKDIFIYFYSLERYISSDTIRWRYLSLFDFLFYEEQTGALLNRSNLFILSWETFMKYPLFGIGNSGVIRQTIGNHSSILDLLAYNGIFLFIIYIFQFFVIIYFSCKRICVKSEKHYYIFVIALFLCFSFINIGFTKDLLYFMIVIVPMMLNITSENEKHSIIIHDV